MKTLVICSQNQPKSRMEWRRRPEHAGRRRKPRRHRRVSQSVSICHKLMASTMRTAFRTTRTRMSEPQTTLNSPTREHSTSTRSDGHRRSVRFDVSQADGQRDADNSFHLSGRRYGSWTRGRLETQIWEIMHSKYRVCSAGRVTSEITGVTWVR